MSELTRAILTDHAQRQMARRGLGEADVRSVLSDPDDIVPVQPGRIVAQKRLPLGTPPRDYLLRVFIDMDRKPPEIVTAYRTSRFAKYRRP